MFFLDPIRATASPTCRRATAELRPCYRFVSLRMSPLPVAQSLQTDRRRPRDQADALVVDQPRLKLGGHALPITIDPNGHLRFRHAGVAADARAQCTRNGF